MTYREELNEMTSDELWCQAVVVWDMLPSDFSNFTREELVEWILGREQEWDVRFGKGSI